MAHARLSPSSASRWIQCPASVHMAETYGKKDTSSVYAEEGTAAHSLAEIRLRWFLDRIDADEYVRATDNFQGEWNHLGIDLDEMIGYVDTYVNYVLQRSAELNASVLLEQKLQTGIPECWGTSDAVLISPTFLESVDLKYGKGVPVSAEGNPQLRLYGDGALEEFGDLLGEVEYVRSTVVQPRLHNVSHETLSAEYLRSWIEDIRGTAEKALNNTNEFGPSESACRWCPVSGNCRAELKAVFEQDFEEEPQTLSPEDLAESVSAVPMIKQWIESVESQALHVAQTDRVPGYKVVRSGSKRRVNDPEGALEDLRAAGFTDEEVLDPPKLKGITALEKAKAMGHISAYVSKTDGKLTLAHEDDKRPAVDEIKEDFQDEG